MNGGGTATGFPAIKTGKEKRWHEHSLERAEIRRNSGEKYGWGSTVTMNTLGMQPPAYRCRKMGSVR
jgi:hypothetical protein